MTRLVVLLLALSVSPAAAQEPTPFLWDERRAVPSRISDALVGAQIVAETVHAWRAEDRWAALGCQALRTGIAAGVTEAIKRLVDRERPNRADQKSMPSMHTALAAVSAGWRPPISASLTVSVAWGRQAAGWHYGSDVVVGAAVGLLARQVCDGGGVR